MLPAACQLIGSEADKTKLRDCESSFSCTSQTGKKWGVAGGKIQFLKETVQQWYWSKPFNVSYLFHLAPSPWRQRRSGWPWQQLPPHALAPGQHCRCVGTIAEQTSGLFLACPAHASRTSFQLLFLPRIMPVLLLADHRLPLRLAGENNQNYPKQTEARQSSQCGSSPQNLGVWPPCAPLWCRKLHCRKWSFFVSPCKVSLPSAAHGPSLAGQATAPFSPTRQPSLFYARWVSLSVLPGKTFQAPPAHRSVKCLLSSKLPPKRQGWHWPWLSSLPTWTWLETLIQSDMGLPWATSPPVLGMEVVHSHVIKDGRGKTTLPYFDPLEEVWVSKAKVLCDSY